jgi:hypothetical protein
MLKIIFRKLVLLITKPEIAWVDFVAEGSPNDKVMNKFCYPLMSMSAGVLLISEALFRRAPVHVLLVHCLVYFITLFSSFFIVRYVLAILLDKRYNITATKGQLTLVTGYSFSIVYIIYILTALSPSFFFLWVFFLYTPYLIWIAADVVFQIKSDARGVFVLGLSALVAGVPWFISLVFNGLFLAKLK